MNTNTKVVIAVLTILLIIVSAFYYFKNNGSQEVAKDAVTPTPEVTTANTNSSDAVKESSVITIKDGTRSETVIFHNSTGFTFASYAIDGNTDRVVASSNGVEILQLGVDWTGFTQGSLPLLKVELVKNSYIGNLYRSAGGGTEDGGYSFASLTKLTGKCTGNGDEVTAPCTNVDQIYGKEKVFMYLPFCTELDSASKCDELMSGLEIKK